MVQWFGSCMKDRKKETRNFRKQIMLIVEDNSDVLEFISSHFQEDFEAQVATNGIEG